MIRSLTLVVLLVQGSGLPPLPGSFAFPDRSGATATAGLTRPSGPEATPTPEDALPWHRSRLHQRFEELEAALTAPLSSPSRAAEPADQGPPRGGWKPAPLESPGSLPRGAGRGLAGHAELGAPAGSSPPAPGRRRFQGAAFMATVADKAWVSKGDCVVAVYMLLGERELPPTWEGALADLKGRALLPPNWSPRAQDLAPQSFASYLFARALGLRGGIVDRVLGLSPRGAYRELVHRRLIAPVGEGTSVTGRELISLLRRGRDFAQGKGGFERER